MVGGGLLVGWFVCFGIFVLLWGFFFLIGWCHWFVLVDLFFHCISMFT